MIYESKAGETPLGDISGLRVKIPGVTRAQLNALEAENIQGAFLKYWPGKARIRFNTKFFRRLHKDMFSKVWSWAGHYRDTQTNLGSDPRAIEGDLAILEKDLASWDPDLESGVRLHHRAVQIHPFLNGNGRWSRLLSDLWLKQYVGVRVAWPVELGAESSLRGEYLAALRAADGLDYNLLLELYKRFQEGV